MRDRGLRGRFNRRPRGRRSKFPLHMLRALWGWLKESPQGYGFETGSWQMDMAIEMVRGEFGVAAKARTLRRRLRRIGFSWRKDRQEFQLYVSAGVLYVLVDCLRLVVRCVAQNHVKFWMSPADVFHEFLDSFGVCGFHHAHIELVF